MKQRNMRVARVAPQDRRRASNWSGMFAFALLGLAGYAQAATDVKAVDKVASVATGYAESLGCAVTLGCRSTTTTTSSRSGHGQPAARTGSLQARWRAG